MKKFSPLRIRFDHANTKFLLTTFVVTMVLLFVWYGSIQWYEKQLLSREKWELEMRYTPQAGAITNSINNHFLNLTALQTFLLIELDSPDRENNFKQFAENILATSKVIRAVQFFPKEGTVWVYPIEGNEATQGRTLDMLIHDERPTVVLDVARTLDTRAITLSGPYELRQGGLGLLARLAIFNEDELEGIVVIIIDIPPLLAEAGLGQEEGFYDMAIQSQAGEVFSGDPLVFEQTPVLFSIPLPEGEWTLAVVPANGWRSTYLPALRIIQISGLLLVLLISTIFALMLQHRNTLRQENERLTSTVAERTLQLQNVVTELENAKDHLEDHKNHLEEIVTHRTTELSQTYERLNLALQHREIILNNMSHELKTPLTAILGMTDLMLRHDKALLNDKQIQSLETIQNSGQHLLTIISNLLDLSKIFSGKLNIRCINTNFKQLCEQIIQQITLLALVKNITVDFQYESILSEVVLDPIRIKQTLVYILENAVKFTPPGGRIGMQVQDQENQLMITIFDTGIGIAEADIERLYEPFFQVDDSLNRQYEGAGLGLPIAHNLVTLHQGTITVQSILGKGTQFIIKLPIAACSMPTHDF